jgi:hypothetical protein
MASSDLTAFVSVASRGYRLQATGGETDAELHPEVLRLARDVLSGRPARGRYTPIAFDRQNLRSSEGRAAPEPSKQFANESKTSLVGATLSDRSL